MEAWGSDDTQRVRLYGKGGRSDYGWPKGKGKGPGATHVRAPHEHWSAAGWDSPEWLAPYAPLYFPEGDLSWYPDSDPYATALNCVAQTCAQNYWQDEPEAVRSCVCEGVRSSCTDFPTSSLCLEVAGVLEETKMSCTTDREERELDVLWRVARTDPATEVCGL